MNLVQIQDLLAPLLADSYKWPEVPAGWQLEFIAYPDGTLEMDILHPVSGRFWSEDNDYLDLPVKKDGIDLCPSDLQSKGIPFMTTSPTTTVVESEGRPHLRGLAN